MELLAGVVLVVVVIAGAAFALRRQYEEAEEAEEAEEDAAVPAASGATGTSKPGERTAEPDPTDPAEMSPDEARELLAEHDAFPFAHDDLDDVLEMQQADVAEGHVVEPLAALGTGDYVVCWSYPGHRGPPLVVFVGKHQDYELLAASPRLHLQFHGAHWMPAWSQAFELEPDLAAAYAAVRAEVGPPPFAPDSDAHEDLLRGHPHFSEALAYYEGHEPTDRAWRARHAARVDGEVDADALDALTTEWQSKPALPPIGILLDRVTRDAFESHHRPWEQLVPTQERPLARLEAFYGLLEAWVGMPETQARLRVEATKVALELLRWDEAERLIETVDHPAVVDEVASLRGAIEAGRSRPEPSGLDALRERVRAASDEERGPLEGELGLRLALEGEVVDAYEHLEQAVMYASSSYPLHDLVMEVAEAIEGGTALSEALRTKVEAGLLGEVEAPAPSAADLMRAMRDERVDRSVWPSLMAQLQQHLFSASDRARAWRRAGRSHEGPWRTLEEIDEPTPGELEAMEELIRQLERGR